MFRIPGARAIRLRSMFLVPFYLFFLSFLSFPAQERSGLPSLLYKYPPPGPASIHSFQEFVVEGEGATFIYSILTYGPVCG